jgi:hypothetical protein
LANYQFFTLSPIDQENILGFGQTCAKLKLLDAFKKFPFFLFKKNKIDLVPSYLPLNLVTNYKKLVGEGGVSF